MAKPRDKHGIRILSPTKPYAGVGHCKPPTLTNFSSMDNKKLIALIEGQGGRCYFCGKILPYEWATIDHLIPKSRGGSNELENLVAACHQCNHAKANRTLKEYRVFVKPTGNNFYGDTLEVPYKKRGVRIPRPIAPEGAESVNDSDV